MGSVTRSSGYPFVVGCLASISMLFVCNSCTVYRRMRSSLDSRLSLLFRLSALTSPVVLRFFANSLFHSLSETRLVVLFVVVCCGHGTLLMWCRCMRPICGLTVCYSFRLYFLPWILVSPPFSVVTSIPSWTLVVIAGMLVLCRSLTPWISWLLCFGISPVLMFGGRVTRPSKVSLGSVLMALLPPRSILLVALFLGCRQFPPVIFLPVLFRFILLSPSPLSPSLMPFGLLGGVLETCSLCFWIGGIWERYI